MKEIRQVAFVIRFFDFGVNPREKNLVEPDCARRFANFDQSLYPFMHLVQVTDEPGHGIPFNKPPRHQCISNLSDQRIFHAPAHATSLTSAASHGSTIETASPYSRALPEILGGAISSPGTNSLRTNRTISAAARGRIAAGARARWARIRGTKPGHSPTQPRRKMSAAAKARLSTIAGARWKKAKAAGKNAL